MFSCGSAFYCPQEWTPADLFLRGETGGFWDFTDSATLYSDTGLTTPATVGGKIQGVRDKSGNNRHMTTATTTILRQNSGGLDYGDFPGTAGLVGFATAVGQTGGGPPGYLGHFAIAGFRPASVATQMAMLDADNQGGFNAKVSQTLQVLSARARSLSWGWAIVGGTQVFDFYDGPVAGIAAGSDYIFDMWRSTTEMAGRVNKVSVASQVETLIPIGVSNSPIGIGSSYAGTTTQNNYPFNGRIYAALFLNRQLYGGELDLVEDWFARHAHL